MRSSLFLLFIQFITIISALPTISPSRSQSQKRSRSRIVKRESLSTVESTTVSLSFEPNLIEYLSTVQIGNPPTSYDLIVNTGSSVLIVGLNKTFIPTAGVTRLTNSIFTTAIGSVVVSGTGVRDDVELAPGFGIQNQTLGLVGVVGSEALTVVDGSLGLGPKEGTPGIFAPNGSEVNTVMDTAAQEGLIFEEIFGIFLKYPASLDPNDLNNTGGLTYGGVDRRSFCGNLHFVNRSLDFAVFKDRFWTINSGQVTLGNSSLISNTDLNIDTATNVVILPEAAFNQYVAITGGQEDKDGFLHFDKDQAANLPDLQFIIAEDLVLTLPAQAQILPPQLNTAPGFAGSFSPDDIIGLVIKDTTGQSNVTTLGQPVLTKYYSAYDNQNNQIGFAPSVNSDGECS